MSRFANARFANARFATVLAVSLALLVSGVVAGAAGQALIIGSANDAGVSNTSLDTTSSGFAWQMYQHGTGVGVFAISDNGVALAALAHNGNQHGLSVTNDGAAGTGAAIIADGKNNTAADFRVNTNSIPPLKVNSTAKVTNLNADLLDGLDSGAFATRLWAVVRGTDAVIIRGQGATVGFKYLGSGGAGSYEIVFNRDITACAWTGTVINLTSGRGDSATAGEIGIRPLSTSANGVSVTTYTSGGVLADHDFVVAVHC